MLRTIRIAAMAIALAACGGGAKSGEGAATPAAGMTGEAGAAALAAQLGIPEAYVATALTAAQSALGMGEQTADSKAAAAQAGVDKAAAQAESEGKPLAEEQKTGLLEGLKGLL
jgi:hypothetical protein